MHLKLMYVWACIIAVVLDVSCTLSGMLRTHQLRLHRSKATPLGFDVSPTVLLSWRLRSFLSRAKFSRRFPSSTVKLRNCINMPVHARNPSLLEYVQPRASKVSFQPGSMGGTVAAAKSLKQIRNLRLSAPTRVLRRTAPLRARKQIVERVSMARLSRS